MGKKFNGNWDIIINEHSEDHSFSTSKAGNFNSVREVIFIITTL